MEAIKRNKVSTRKNWKHAVKMCLADKKRMTRPHSRMHNTGEGEGSFDQVVFTLKPDGGASVYHFTQKGISMKKSSTQN